MLKLNTLKHLKYNTCNIQTGNTLSKTELIECLNDIKFLSEYLSDLKHDNELMKYDFPDLYTKDIKELEELIKTLKKDNN